jgi:hypothetical protein
MSIVGMMRCIVAALQERPFFRKSSVWRFAPVHSRCCGGSTCTQCLLNGRACQPLVTHAASGDADSRSTCGVCHAAAGGAYLPK